MKHIATVPAAIVKAAMLFQAKQDVRYYLNGIYITADHVVATDGHAMFVCPYESDLRPERPVIVAVKGKIPAKAYNLELMYDEESKIGVVRCVQAMTLRIRVINPLGDKGADEKDVHRAIAVTDANGNPENAFFRIIDGNFPDWQRVMPSGDLVPTGRFGIDFGYADRVAKACKELGAKFSHCAVNMRGAETSIEVELRSPCYHGAKVIIMPCRM